MVVVLLIQVQLPVTAEIQKSFDRLKILDRLARRRPATVDLSEAQVGLGRELFDTFRANAAGAEQGAMSYGLSDRPSPWVLPGRAAAA